MKILLFSTMTGQHTRNAMQALFRNGMLHSYHTTTAIIEGGIMEKLSGKISFLREFGRRVFPKNARPYIHSYWLRELSRIILSKLGLKRLFPRLFDTNRQSVVFDQKIAKYIEKHAKEIDAVYGYEDTSSFSFQVAKKYGIKRLYELPIGYWRAKERILREQGNARPDWKCTIPVADEPQDKLARKDMEIALADVVIVPSEFVKETLNDYPSQLPPIKIVQYGGPGALSNIVVGKSTHEKLKVLFCGSLTQRKGLAEVFEVCTRLADKVDLTLIGNGLVDQCIPLKDGCSKFNWIKSVSHDELLRIMGDMDLMLFPSHFEGFALVVLDAMSQGLPVITTPITCGPIKDGYDGWIVEPGNVEEMTHILERLYINREEITSCSHNALKTASENAWDKYGAKLVTALKDVI